MNNLEESSIQLKQVADALGTSVARVRQLLREAQEHAAAQAHLAPLPGEPEDAWIFRIKLEAAKQVCPGCLAQDAVPIFYGLIPDFEVEELRKKWGTNGFICGGCAIQDERWHCRSCQRTFVHDAATS